MRKTGFYTAEKTFWHSVGVTALHMPIGGWVQPPNNGGGSDTPDTKRRILNLMDAGGLTKNCLMMEADPATMEDLRRVHTEDYLTEFKAVSDDRGGEVGEFAPFSKGAFEIALLSAGLAIRALDDVWTGAVDNSYALCRPCGHHCRPSMAMGFCLLANIGIAIEALKAKHNISRIAVVDWDVHHGNGTQEIFYERDDVLTISIHQDGCYPIGYDGDKDRGEGKGLGYNYNIPLPPGTGHNNYLEAVRELVIPILDDYKPEMIIIASGLDANSADPMARMLLHSESYREMTKMVMDAADRLCDGKIAVIQEGGYSEAYVCFCGVPIVEELVGKRCEVEDPNVPVYEGMQPKPHVEKFISSLIQNFKQDFGLTKENEMAK